MTSGAEDRSYTAYVITDRQTDIFSFALWRRASCHPITTYRSRYTRWLHRSDIIVSLLLIVFIICGTKYSSSSTGSSSIEYSSINSILCRVELELQSSLEYFLSNPSTCTTSSSTGRDCQNRLARPNSQARTRTGKYSFSLFSWPRAGLTTLPGWSILLLYVWPYYGTSRRRSRTAGCGSNNISSSL